MPLHIPDGEVVDVHAGGMFDGDVRAVWVRGEKVWPTTIMDFEGSTDVSDWLRGTDTGSASITSDAALATDQGSTQGLRQDGFSERYANAGDQQTDLRTNQEVSFYFRPHNIGVDQYHFMIAPQSGASSPPDQSYRIEFHMDGGARITKMPGREILATENNTNWSSGRIYEVTFRADQDDGVSVSYANESLEMDDTEYIRWNTIGFGFRASYGGLVDWDWLGY